MLFRFLLVSQAPQQWPWFFPPPIAVQLSEPLQAHRDTPLYRLWKASMRISSYKNKEEVILTLCLDHAVQLRQRLEIVVFDINFLVGKRDWYHDACKIQEVDGASISVVLELVVPDGSRGSDGCHNGVYFPAKLVFNAAQCG